MASCETCFFWEDTNDSGGHEGYRHGKCRRFPPATTSQWPFTLPGDWCGEYKWEGDDGLGNREQEGQG